MKTEQKKEYIVPQIEMIDANYELQLLSCSGCKAWDESEEPQTTHGGLE